jgi:hypothetical protein
VTLESQAIYDVAVKQAIVYLDQTGFREHRLKSPKQVGNLGQLGADTVEMVIKVLRPTFIKRSRFVIFVNINWKAISRLQQRQ